MMKGEGYLMTRLEYKVIAKSFYLRIAGSYVLKYRTTSLSATDLFGKELSNSEYSGFWAPPKRKVGTWMDSSRFLDS